MLDMVYSDDIDSVIKKLTDLEKKQVPFAMSKAINRVAFEARAGVLARMDDRFTIRERSLKATGGGKKPLFVETSNKKQSVIQAVIGTPLWFLEDQEAGGERRKTSAWLPASGARAGRRDSGRISKKFNRVDVRKEVEKKAPSRRRRSKRNPVPYAPQIPFIATMKSGKRGVFIRRSKKKRTPISLLYTVNDSVKIAPRWKFGETVQHLSDKRLRAYFLAELEAAMASSKKGPLKSWYVTHLLESEKQSDAGFAAGGLEQLKSVGSPISGM
tara:strand:+ start:110 stop:922 length:813 start_codon:yes stop_codon:yes gene_type:complete